MATNPSTPEQRHVVSVEILHLDETGYGPQGMYTRRVWREACLNHLLAGRKTFKAWQESWISESINLDSTANHDYKIIYSDDSFEVKQIHLQNPCNLDYVGHFFDDSTFWNLEFLINVNFQGARFNNDAFFKETVFKEFVFFTEAEFQGHTIFEKCRFSYAYFTKSKFKYEADFTESEFGGDAYFSEVVFHGMSRFVNVQFNALAYFKDVIFEGESWFFSTKFFGDAVFIRSEFHSSCIFNKWLSIGSYGAEFYRSADFENTVYRNIGHFEYARFVTNTPSFRGCKIDSTRLEFSDDNYFPPDENSDDAIKNISFLKRLAEEHGQTEQALNFNAMELRAKAASDDASWNFIIVTWLYKNLSDFGRSFLRPLTAYAIILFITFLIALEHSAFNAPRTYTQNGCEKYVWWIERVTWVGDKNCQRSDKEKNHKLTGIRAAGEYTLYRAVGVLDFADSDKQTIEVANRLFAQDYEPWWMRIYGIFKAIASTALLFLAALGLRNKYRIK